MVQDIHKQYELGILTPPEGFEAYQRNKRLATSDEKKPAQGAGSSRLISDEGRQSPAPEQPKFD